MNEIIRRFVLALGLLAASSLANSAEPKPGDIVENSLKMKLAYIAPGEFDMGSPDSEKDREKDEKLHHVRLTKGFYLGAHEVTQAQFQRILGRNPSFFSKVGNGRLIVESEVPRQDTASFPVETVTWYDAVEFCNELSKIEGLPEYYTLREVRPKDRPITSAKVAENGGKGYRLPTEAEWEFACRAGTKTPFHFGDALNGIEANVGELLEPYGTSTKGKYLGRTSAVGSYAANAFGLYDMHGNVREWCADSYGDYPGDEVDPTGLDSGGERVLRGGGWHDYARWARSANRGRSVSGKPWLYYGFRVAFTRTP